jgi:signal transduction histidine kinase
VTTVTVPGARAAHPPRRVLRDRAADAAYVASAGALGGLFLFGELADAPGAVSMPFLAGQAAAGVAGCLALLLRRRRPAAVAVGLIAAGLLYSPVAFGASMLALLNVAVRCSWRITAALATAHAVIAAGLMSVVTATPREFWEGLIFLLLLDSVLVASGLLVRSQRLLVDSLRDRARQAEEGQRLRIEEARRLERERIAREMHDVLAHRISLLTLHAGALEFRPEAPPVEIARAAGVIRSCAHGALEDLREVIGVLREPAGADGEDPQPDRPQPTLTALPGLIEESRRSGMVAAFTCDVADLAAVPASLGRHAYRIAQEGLTNARKHAPGAPVEVTVTGSAGGALTVEIENPRPAEGTVAQLPGAGAGLIGLRERAVLAGGELEHGATEHGTFRLRASVPWPA